jgi:anthranilate synthase component 2
VPILGVCLGHQSIGQAFGGKVVRAKEIMHGKTSLIHHDGKGVFRGVPNPFEATRYHSLVVEQSTLPADLEVSAWTLREDGSIDEIMGLRHRSLRIEGVQFHPESILTQHGHDLLRNFLVEVLPRAA